MGKYLGILIFLGVALVQIVASLQKAAKEKEMKRQAGLGQPDRPTVSTRAQTGRAGAQQQSPLAAVRSRAEDLAARRRAQLEELRRRRGGQGRTTVSQPAARPASATPNPVFPAPAASPPQVGPDRGFVSATEKAERRLQARREALQQKQEKARRRKMESQVQPVQTRARQQTAAVPSPPPAQVQQRVKAIDVYARPEDDTTSTPAKRIRALLSNRQSLQTAFILKEVIDPPISMRERE